MLSNKQCLLCKTGYVLKDKICTSSCINPDPYIPKCLDSITVCANEKAIPPFCNICKDGFVKNTSANNL